MTSHKVFRLWKWRLAGVIRGRKDLDKAYEGMLFRSENISFFCRGISGRIVMFKERRTEKNWFLKTRGGVAGKA